MAVSVLIAVALLLASDPKAEICTTYDGATVVAHDGTVLGRIAPVAAPDSIFNRLGIHGRKSAKASIWNTLRVHGDRYAMTSVFNPRAQRPPQLIKAGHSVGVLNVARDRRDAVSPLLLGAVCYSYFPD